MSFAEAAVCVCGFLKALMCLRIAREGCDRRINRGGMMLQCLGGVDDKREALAGKGRGEFC